MFEKILTFTRKRHVAGLKCAFTGHRPQNLPFRFDETDGRCLRLKAELRKLIVQMIEQKNVTHFISGMALGIDTYTAEIVLDLKSQFPFITLECAIPCETQAAKWSERYRNRYFAIVERCDKETLLQTHYTPDCMKKRNRYMVEHYYTCSMVMNHASYASKYDSNTSFDKYSYGPKTSVYGGLINTKIQFLRKY